MFSGKLLTGSVLKIPAKKFPIDAIINKTPPIFEPVFGNFLIRYKPNDRKLMPNKIKAIFINQPAVPNAYSLMGCHIGFTEVLMKCNSTNRTKNPMAPIFEIVNLFI
ncbi:hypothetical protein GCM10007384_29970 [Aquimarina muelleri]|uniref:Uncharacterized protein n=1 Tax=Aquimarina muelleri TaxID=279356 RepID=A0A918N510_9FLAO|nr:hypothetical protein GCM10007384_29970 [Aquimarina muelleri]